MAASANPLRRGSQRRGMLGQQNHAAGGANGFIMVWMIVCLCFASQKPSKQEFILPTRMDLNIELCK